MHNDWPDTKITAERDPDLGEGLFGLAPHPDPLIRILPVPYEATTSYGHGTAEGPGAIFDASVQLDFRDRAFGDVWSVGIDWADVPPEIPALSAVDRGDTRAVNDAGERVCSITRSFVVEEIAAGRVPAVVGGEHAISLGGILGAADIAPLGVLQIDAHHDFRLAYEGYTHSHASVIYNALERAPKIERLVPVGIRDYAREEAAYAASQGDRVRTFYDRDLTEELAHGATWHELCAEIVQCLPDRVWITFDIDGLDPSLCPGTGTPVPGGLSFQHACHLLHTLAHSGRRVVGFDLVEVAQSEGDEEWNANVGARVLYQLCGCAAVSRL